MALKEGLDVAVAETHFLARVGAVPLKKPYVAIVDDDSGFANYLRTFLSARGYILRRVTGYGFPNALRMTVGNEAANRGVVAALSEFLGR